MTRRNYNHPYHSSPLHQHKFNQPKYRELKIKSRFDLDQLADISAALISNQEY